MKSAFAPLVLLAACGGGSSPAPTVGPRAVSTTTAVSTCDEAPPPLGMRRIKLELATGPGQAEVTVDGAPRAGADSGTACGTADLAPGAHQVTLRARGDKGLGVRFAVTAQHAAWTYDVFKLACGLPGACGRDELATTRTALQANRQGVWDPCSGMQLRDVKWDTSRVPGGDQVLSIDLSFTVFVYDKPFDLPPRDPGCPAS